MQLKKSRRIDEILFQNFRGFSYECGVFVKSNSQANLQLLWEDGFLDSSMRYLDYLGWNSTPRPVSAPLHPLKKKTWANQKLKVWKMMFKRTYTSTFEMSRSTERAVLAGFKKYLGECQCREMLCRTFWMKSLIQTNNKRSLMMTSWVTFLWHSPILCTTCCRETLYKKAPCATRGNVETRLMVRKFR